MILLLDGDSRHETVWHADRELARGLLAHIVDELAGYDTSIGSLDGLGIYRGPGSFTGLRIGCATLNTIAASEAIPIVGTTGMQWQSDAVVRLHAGEDDRIVLPEYGRDARITKPRK